MEHANDNDPYLSVTARITALTLLFAVYFTVRAAVPDLPLHVQQALADLPWESEGAMKVMSLVH
jgi:hypothetical protein